ncbi:hypothetical protein GQ457_16G017430 [Hibiscus cannabinus]
MVSTPLHRGRQDLVVDQSCDMRAPAVFMVNTIVVVSTPLHRGRQDWVVNSILCDVRAATVFRVDAIVRVSTPLHRRRQDLVYINWVTCVPLLSSGTLLSINWGDMRAAAVFKVDAIVRVSTPLHRGRQDLVDAKTLKVVWFFLIENVRPVELTPYKFVGCYDQYESNAPSLRIFKSNVPKSFASHENCMLNDHYVNV